MTAPKLRLPILLRRLVYAPPSGLALVEFGLAAPVLMLLLVGLVDFGLGFYQALQIQGAAAAGAEYATVHGYNQSNIQSVVTGSTNLTGVSAAASQVCGCANTGTFNTFSVPASGVCFNSQCSGCASGSSCPAGLYVSVTSTLNYTPLLSNLGLKYALSLPSSVALTGQAYRRLQ